MKIVIKPDGTARCVYSDAIVELLRPLIDRITVRRASHVEPNADCTWTADLSPVGGPMLGPFEKREQALAAEVRWIQDHL